MATTDKATKGDLEEMHNKISNEFIPVKKDTAEIRKILTGNGDPKKGLIVQVERHDVILVLILKLLCWTGAAGFGWAIVQILQNLN